MNSFIPDLADPVPQDIDQAASRVSSAAIEALRGVRLLVTGGTGFLGSWMVDVLRELNSRHQLNLRITLLTRKKSALAGRRPDWIEVPEVSIIEGDVRTFDCANTRFTHVVHAATDTNAAAGLRPRELADVIVEGSRHVLDIAARSGAKRYLYFSSGAVVGQVNDSRALIGEDEPTAPRVDDPLAAYGNAKRFSEHLHMISAAEFGLEVVIARGFAFVGPRMPLDGHFAMGNFIRDAISGKSPQLNSAGTALRSYLYAADAAVWLITMLALGLPGSTYNVGSDEAISVRQLAERTAGNFGLPSPLVPQVDTFCPCNIYVPDIRRAYERLGLSVWTALDHAILKTAHWARAIVR